MTTRPRVSVALCTRNGARFVAEQLHSILSQTYPVTEVVVSDDASGDGTVEIVRRVLEAHPDPARTDRIVINDPPLGVVANFESAVAACTGELIALSDQDDVWHEDRVAAAVEAFSSPEVLASHSDARLVDADGTPLGLSLLSALEVAPGDLERIREGDAVPVYIRRNLATGATMTIRRELAARARPFPEHWVHDEWLVMVAALTGRVVVDRRELVDYRQHGANEIGVRAPTLRYKVRRVLAPRGDRNRTLAARAAELRDRVPSLGGVTDADARLVVEKADFEAFRAALPAARLRRIGPVLSVARAGLYGRLASRGRADVIRDLLQSA